jgi:hypothetical protein
MRGCSSLVGRSLRTFLAPQPAPASSLISWGFGRCKDWDEQGDLLDPSLFTPDYYPFKGGLTKTSLTSNVEVRRVIEEKSETVSLRTSIKDIIPDELYEYDIIVPLIPKKRYNIKLEIKSRKKANPTIVDPDWI